LSGSASVTVVRLAGVARRGMALAALLLVIASWCGAGVVRAEDGDGRGAPGNAPVAGLEALLRAYSRAISRWDGDRCSMTPTCAGYAAQAFRRLGILRGMSFALERLLRDTGLPDRDRPLRLTAEGWRIEDSLEANLPPGLRQRPPPGDVPRWPDAARAGSGSLPAPR
jgi:hypothetical protein